MKRRGIVAAQSRKRNFILIRPEGEERRIICHRSELLDDQSRFRPGTPVEFHTSGARPYEARKVQIAA